VSPPDRRLSVPSVPRIGLSSHPPRPTVGNDVVDLTAPRAAGRAADDRFLERVFTSPERAVIRAAADPDLELWHAWAAKEAAYKVVSKLLPAPPLFAHRAFEVTWWEKGTAGAEGPTPEAETTGAAGADAPSWRVGAPARAGVVEHGDHAVDVWAEVVRDGGALHVVALDRGARPAGGRLLRTVDRLERAGAPWAAPLDELRGRMTDREREAVHSHASAAVRIGARSAIAALLDVDPARVEIVCRPGAIGRRPPLALVDSVPAAVDLSLSHDGPWIAWSLAPHAGPDDARGPGVTSPSTSDPSSTSDPKAP